MKRRSIDVRSRSARGHPPPWHAEASGCTHRLWANPIILAGLFIVTAVAYRPAWHGGFVWDDAGHITAPALRSLEGLCRIWVDIGATQQYYPAVHSLFWLQAAVWGDDPLGYHLVNIALHSTSAFLFWIALRIIGAPGAALAALIFALHPVHVESVAWISELKNTLSAVFFLAAAVAYLKFDDARSGRYYTLALVAFCFALLSKTVTASFPAAMLAVLWWRHGILIWRRDVAPLLPFLFIALPFGLLTVWFEWTVIGAGSLEMPLSERVLVAGRVPWFYLGKLLWPASLTFHYPRWIVDAADPSQWSYPLALLVLLWLCWRIQHQCRGPFAALAFFLVCLGPASGFVSIYPFRYSFVADHFQYHASLGPIALFAAAFVGGSGALVAALRPRTHLINGGAAPRAVRRPAGQARRLRIPAVFEGGATPPAGMHRRPNAGPIYEMGSKITWTAGLMIALTLFFLTWKQSQNYVSEESLWRATLKGNPDSLAARTGLAALLVTAGPSGATEALVHAERAVELDPTAPSSHYNLGRAHEELANWRAAAEAYRVSLDLLLAAGDAPNPFRAMALHGLGKSLAAQDRLSEAIPVFESALRDTADPPSVLTDLGAALAMAGRQAEAITVLERALVMDPDSVEAAVNLGGALIESGRYIDATQILAQVLEATPNDVDARYNLGIAQFMLEQYSQAARHFARLAATGTEFDQARRYLIRCLVSARSAEEKEHILRDAIDEGLEPASLHSDLGELLVSLGRAEEGRDHLARARAISPW